MAAPAPAAPLLNPAPAPAPQAGPVQVAAVRFPPRANPRAHYRQDDHYFALCVTRATRALTGQDYSISDMSIVMYDLLSKIIHSVPRYWCQRIDRAALVAYLESQIETLKKSKAVFLSRFDNDRLGDATDLDRTEIDLDLLRRDHEDEMEWINYTEKALKTKMCMMAAVVILSLRGPWSFHDRVVTVMIAFVVYLGVGIIRLKRRLDDRASAFRTFTVFRNESESYYDALRKGVSQRQQVREIWEAIVVDVVRYAENFVARLKRSKEMSGNIWLGGNQNSHRLLMADLPFRLDRWDRVIRSWVEEEYDGGAAAVDQVDIVTLDGMPKFLRLIGELKQQMWRRG
ncbi:hypothetical protein QBC44DRAFT_335796 [Cladorrhinum sp. PSN332]|nr:hypothetical protein QBC44DRAFT_335796 [Cladorrhinum sp. PSN332]